MRQRGYDIVYPRRARRRRRTISCRAFPGCVGWLAGVEPISNRVLDAAGGLKVISRNGTGVDNIDLEEAKARGIAVERAMGANARGVASLRLACCFRPSAMCRGSDAKIACGEVGTPHRHRGEGQDPRRDRLWRDRREVARLAIGLDMQVLAYDPYPANDIESAASDLRR